MYDLIIIGGGPAGLAAGVYAARKEMKTLLLTKEFGGQPMWTSGVENYMGFQFVTGPELMIKFDEQIRQFPIEIKYEEVESVVKMAEGSFSVKSSYGEYLGKTVIIATGKRPKKLNVPGEEEFIGRGVAFCATCDGPFFKEKIVAVVGGGNSGIQAAIELSRIAKKVYLITQYNYSADSVLIKRMKSLENVIEYQNTEVIRISGHDTVTELLVMHKENEKEEIVHLDGIFVEIGLDPNSHFVKNLISLNEQGEIPVNLNNETEIPGLFAAGDITNVKENQIIIAAGEGAKATLRAFEHILRLDEEMGHE